MLHHREIIRSQLCTLGIGMRSSGQLVSQQTMVNSCSLAGSAKPGDMEINKVDKARAPEGRW